MAGIPSSITVEKIALFIKYWSEDNFDACEIYIISDNQFTTVSNYDLSLLSHNR